MKIKENIYEELRNKRAGIVEPKIYMTQIKRKLWLSHHGRVLLNCASFVQSVVCFYMSKWG